MMCGKSALRIVEDAVSEQPAYGKTRNPGRPVLQIVDQHLREFEHCRSMAETSRSPEAKMEWLALAASWLKLHAAKSGL
jgi:hypothetical protein